MADQGPHSKRRGQAAAIFAHADRPSCQPACLLLQPAVSGPDLAWPTGRKQSSLARSQSIHLSSCTCRARSAPESSPPPGPSQAINARSKWATRNGRRSRKAPISACSGPMGQGIPLYGKHAASSGLSVRAAHTPSPLMHATACFVRAELNACRNASSPSVVSFASLGMIWAGMPASHRRTLNAAPRPAHWLVGGALADTRSELAVLCFPFAPQ
jgi:hypothetical protein